MRSLPDCAGRVAFVSGSSRGIGAGLAKRFAEAGMRLVLCSRSAPVLEASQDVVTAQFDIRDEEALETLVRTAEDRFGSIDLWVNNAGMLAPIAPVRDVSAEDFQNHVEVNLLGVFLGSRAYVNHIRRQKREGVLINISSGAAWKPYAGWGAYCAGKAGVERLTEVIAEEERSAGLRAYSVAPGVVDTAMQKLIRETPEERFPDVERFHARKQANAFNRVEFVAEELLSLAFDPARAGEEVAVRLPDERG